MIIQVPRKPTEIVKMAIFKTIGKNIVAPSVAVRGISNKIAARTWANPTKRYHPPVWKKASKKNPTGSSDVSYVKRFPNNFVIPERIKVIAKITRLKAVK